MKVSYYGQYVNAMQLCLERVEVTDRGGSSVSNEDWLTRIGDMTEEVKTSKGRFFFAGNGASAAFASHMSLDWSKNGGVPAIPLLDLSHLTALGNDLGYDEVFSTPVGWHGKPSDLLVTISSSGNSPNIIRAIEVAREKGLKVITFTGLKPENRSRTMGDLNIYVPAKTYGIVECAHQVLLHAWLDYSMGVTEWDRDEVQNMRADEFKL